MDVHRPPAVGPEFTCNVGPNGREGAVGTCAAQPPRP